MELVVDLGRAIGGGRSGGLMASSDNFYITVKGRQTHGAAPWAGVDPIVPDSPMPFAPSGLRGLSVWVFDVSKLHNSAADGIA